MLFDGTGNAVADEGATDSNQWDLKASLCSLAPRLGRCCLRPEERALHEGFGDRD